MTERQKPYNAVYLAILACCLAIAAMKEDDFKSAANRADIRVAVMEIKNQTSIITDMRKWRNDQRKRGDHMEKAVLFLTIALATAASALIAGPIGGGFLIGVSLGAASIVGRFVWLAFVG